MALDETQQQFAHRLGTSVVSIARYETNQIPSELILSRLVQLASESGFDSYASILMNASADTSAEVPPLNTIREVSLKTDDELWIVPAVLRVLRRDDLYPDLRRKLEKLLARPIEDIRAILDRKSVAEEAIPQRVVKLVQQGLSTESIGKKLGIEEETVTFVFAKEAVRRQDTSQDK